MSRLSEVSVIKNNPTTVYEANPWLDAAAEAASDLGKILKFSKGKYFIGEEVVPPGTEYITHVDQVARGWSKFADKKISDRRIGKLADRYVVPKREELGDLDKSKWEKASNGDPRDPWALQWYLPL